jgi:hypothetical protein
VVSQKFVALLCGDDGSAATSPLLSDAPHRLRRGDLHPTHRRAQINATNF